MKNITNGYANEGAGLTYTGAIHVDKASETHYSKYAVAHAQCLRPKVEADDRKFKAMQESFDKTTDMYMAIDPLSIQNMHNECLFLPRSHDR